MEGWRKGIIYHYLQASVNKNFIALSHCWSRITENVSLAKCGAVYLSTTAGAALWLPSKASGAQSSNRARLPVPSWGPVGLVSRPTKLRAFQAPLLHFLGLLWDLRIDEEFIGVCLSLEASPSCRCPFALHGMERILTCPE